MSDMKEYMIEDDLLKDVSGGTSDDLITSVFVFLTFCKYFDYSWDKVLEEFHKRITKDDPHYYEALGILYSQWDEMSKIDVSSITRANPQ